MECSESAVDFDQYPLGHWREHDSDGVTTGGQSGSQAPSASENRSVPYGSAARGEGVDSDVLRSDRAPHELRRPGSG